MDIAVAAFYLLNEAALGVVGVAHERAITDVIGKGGKEKAVFAVGAEHLAELAEVTAEQDIGLLSGEWKTEMFAGLDAVTISDIGIILGMVKPLKELDATDCPLEWGQLINAVTLCWSHGNGEDECDDGYDDSHCF